LTQKEFKNLQKDQKEKGKPKKQPPHCKYLGEVFCIYHDTIIEDVTYKKRDHLGRPNKPFCTGLCIPHIMPMHQYTSQYEIWINVARQLMHTNEILKVVARIMDKRPEKLSDKGLHRPLIPKSKKDSKIETDTRRIEKTEA